jgi:hypothetical protein
MWLDRDSGDLRGRVPRHDPTGGGLGRPLRTCRRKTEHDTGERRGVDEGAAGCRERVAR